MRIFVVSMPGRHVRKESALAILRPTGLRFELVDGVEARRWRGEELPLAPGAWASLTPPQVGCYLAHLRALQRILDYDLPYACILEDDFHLLPDPDFGLAEMPKFLPEDFDYIHILEDLRLHDRWQRFPYNEHLDRILGTPLSTIGYVVSRGLADRILQEHGSCSMPIDHLYCRLSHTGRFFMARKAVVGVRWDLPTEMG